MYLYVVTVFSITYNTHYTYSYSYKPEFIVTIPVRTPDGKVFLFHWAKDLFR